MRVLVTGAGGMLGLALAPALEQAGHVAVPFQDGDADQLARDPMPVLDTYCPGASEMLRERGVDSLAPITVRYPMDHAKQVLGFEPECNFEQWLDQLSNRPDERAGTSPPWP